MIRLTPYFRILPVFMMAFVLHSCGYVMHPDMPQATYFDEANQVVVQGGAAVQGNIVPATGQVSYSVTDFAAVAVQGSYYKKLLSHSVSNYDGRDSTFYDEVSTHSFGASGGYIFPNDRWQVWLGGSIGKVNFSTETATGFLAENYGVYFYQSTYRKLFLQMNFILVHPEEETDGPLEVSFYGRLSHHKYNLKKSRLLDYAQDSVLFMPQVEDSYLYMMAGMNMYFHLEPAFCYLGVTAGAPVNSFVELEYVDPYPPAQAFFGVGFRIN